MKRALIFTPLLLSAAGLVTSCQRCGAPKETPAPETKTLVFGSTQEPGSVDPLLADSAAAREIIGAFHRELTAYDPKWRTVPSLAKELPSVTTTTSGQMRVLWTLRDGLAWSDGAPLTAEDLVFGHQIATDPKVSAMSESDREGIAGVRAISKMQFEVRWRSQRAGFDRPRLHPILPAHAYPRPGKTEFVGRPKDPLANGPYRVARWVAGQSLTLERNPSWPGKKPEFDQLIWRFFGTEDGLEAALSSGQVDVLGEASGLSLERAMRLKDRLKDTHVVELSESGVWLQLTVRLDDPVTSKIQVRRAIDVSLDRGAMNEVVYGGQASVSAGMFPPHLGLSGEDPPAFDPARGRSLLDEAGFSNRDKKPITLDLGFASGSDASERAALYVQSALKQIGISIRLKSMPLRVLFDKMGAHEHPALNLFAWRLSPDFDPGSIFRTGALRNYSGISDQELDHLVDEAQGAKTQEGRMEALGKVDKRFRETLPAVSLLFRRSVSVRPIHLSGFSPTGTATPVTWNVEEWAQHAPEGGGAIGRPKPQ